jgi:putative colanic acid biosynthesis acetyltransferase WcaF
MIDVEQKCSPRKWAFQEQAGCNLWTLDSLFFTFNPRPLWGWRRFVLWLFGAQIDPQVHIYPTVRIAIPWNIDVGNSAALGDRVVLSSRGFITIGAWSTVLLGVNVGNKAIVDVCVFVIKNMQTAIIIAGNLAIERGQRV